MTNMYECIKKCVIEGLKVRLKRKRTFSLICVSN